MIEIHSIISPAIFGEELVKKGYFLCLGWFEYVCCMFLFIPIPAINSYRESSEVSSQLNSLKSRCPQYPFLWKKSKKFSRFILRCSIRSARSWYMSLRMAISLRSTQIGYRIRVYWTVLVICLLVLASDICPCIQPIIPKDWCYTVVNITKNE